MRIILTLCPEASVQLVQTGPSSPIPQPVFGTDIWLPQAGQRKVALLNPPDTCTRSLSLRVCVSSVPPPGNYFQFPLVHIVEFALIAHGFSPLRLSL